jgi:hypothetical protein
VGLVSQVIVATNASLDAKIDKLNEGLREIQEDFLYFKEKLGKFLGRLSEEDSEEEHENEQAGKYYHGYTAEDLVFPARMR